MPAYPPYSVIRKVSPNGMIAYHNFQIGVGRRWTGARLRVVAVTSSDVVYG